MTIAELTNNELTELTYSSSKPAIRYDGIYELCALLKRAGIDVKTTRVYGQELSEAVKRFQKKIGDPETGTLNEATLAKLTAAADENSPAIVAEAQEGGDYVIPNYNGDNGINPHYSPYFDPKNSKTFRQNRKDIKIVLGGDSITKTIIGVFLRSQTVEFDTSGNPISEIYEFVARDIKESDESLDAAKYTAEEPNTAPSDVQYQFNF